MEHSHTAFYFHCAAPRAYEYRRPRQSHWLLAKYWRLCSCGHNYESAGLEVHKSAQLLAQCAHFCPRSLLNRANLPARLRK